jgi:hypothetical protein
MSQDVTEPDISPQVPERPSPIETANNTDHSHESHTDNSHSQESHSREMSLALRQTYEAPLPLISDSAEILGGLTIGDKHFKTTEELLQWLSSIPKTDAYRIINNCHDVAFEQLNAIEQVLCDIHTWAQNHEVYEGTHDVHQFEEKWKEVAKIAQRRAAQRKTMDSLRQRAIREWGDRAQSLLIHLRTKSMFDVLSKMLNAKLAFDDVRNAVNNAMIERIGGGKQGNRSQKRITQGDLEKVVNHRQFKKPRARKIRSCNLQISQDGFCCEHGKGNDPDDQDDDLSAGSDNDSDVTIALPRIRTVSNTPAPALNPDINMEDAGNSQIPPLPEDTTMEDVLSIPPPATTVQGPTAAVALRKLPTDCMCTVRCSSMNRVINTAVKAGTLRAKLVMLRTIGKTIHLVGFINEQSICREHAFKLFELFDMNANSKSHKNMTTRISYLYQHLDLFDYVVKTNPWFQPKPDLTSDGNRGFYRWAHAITPPLIADFAKCVWLTPLELIRRIFPEKTPRSQSALAKRLPEEMERNGSIVIPGLFSYLTEDWDGEHPGGIMPLIQEEIEMYEYHFRQQPNRPRLGWNRVMWHALSQQLIRQDIAYYLCYVFFRPDHAYRLISFPYYMKSTQIGEKTFFRHIDINIDDFVQTGRGRNILQGSVSLCNEDDHNCTEILPKMHHHIADWWKDVKKRRTAQGKKHKNGLVQGIDSTMWTAEDAIKYKTKWTKQVCKTLNLLSSTSAN